MAARSCNDVACWQERYPTLLPSGGTGRGSPLRDGRGSPRPLKSSPGLPISVARRRSAHGALSWWLTTIPSSLSGERLSFGLPAIRCVQVAEAYSGFHSDV
jgi:hypothetical protein